MSLPIQGSCLCGAIQFRINQVPTSVSICHCSSCRKSVGASSVSWLTVARESLVFTKEKPQIFQSSVKVLRTFCGKCGSSLTYQSEDTPATIDVTTSTISNPEDYPPTEEVWLSHQLPWDVNYESIPKYLEDSP
ncbi:MAG: GFA family protein [Methylotenera sp.]